MARKTRRRTRRRRRRQRGGNAEPEMPEPTEAELGGLEGGDDMGGDDAPMTGGKRRRKGRKSRKSRRKTKKKRRTKKRGLNGFFKLMLNAKKKGLSSFKYKGKTYKGRKHHRLGMIYKKA